MANEGVHLKWSGKKQFIGTDSGNHSIVISSHDPENHTGMKPSDLLLISLASCSAYDVVEIIQKKKIDLKTMEIQVKAEQDEDPPWTFRQIRLLFKFSGRGLNDKAVKQAIDLAVNSYCSVAATISGKAEILTSYEILPVSHGREPDS
ncbi:MAG: OsmC family protein [Anaerolineales bacterium]